ncbi:MAG: dihydrofolate reductase family protein [Bacteroidota bacterium]
MSSTCTIHMVASLDGFIAKKDGSIDWLQSNDSFENGLVLTEQEIEKFLGNIDCYVMGSKTYEHALKLGWPYGDKSVIVITSRELKKENSYVDFYYGDLEQLVDNLEQHYKNIWIVGGAMLTKAFLRLKLADDIIISFMPVLLGDGLHFFDYIGHEQPLHLKDIKAYKDGMVELWYEIRK